MMFHWFPFVVAQLVGELPWLVICTTIYCSYRPLPRLRCSSKNSFADWLLFLPFTVIIWLFVTFPIGLITDPTHAGGS